jgi:hypothetical protein
VNLASKLLEILAGLLVPLLIAGLAMELSRLVILTGLWLAAVRRQRLIADVVPVDVTDQVELPVELTAILSELEMIGFTRIGEAQVTPPGRPTLTMWVLAAPDGLCHAEVSRIGIGGMPVALFVSMFSAYTDNRAFAVTAYPSGPETDQPDYIAHTVRESLTAAYRHQCSLVKRYQESPRAQFRVDSMGQFIEYSRIYNTRFTGRLGWTSQRRRLGGIASSAYDMVVFGGLVAASIWLGVPHSLLAFLILPLLLSMILVNWLLTKEARSPARPHPGKWRDK